jgi:hypothetical protein
VGPHRSPPSSPRPSIQGGQDTASSPRPPEPSTRSTLEHYEALSENADVVLIQQNVPWQDFDPAWDGESQTITDMNNGMSLARQNGMDVIFVVDGLNGLIRREFIGVPMAWDAYREQKQP